MNHHHLRAALGLALILGCNQNVEVGNTSATEDDDFFPGTTTTDSDFLPTTTATDGEPPVDPSDFCELHPDDDFAGEVFACEGTFALFIAFDYYGSPDIALNTVLPCIDSSVLGKDPGYVYTCLAQINDTPFGPASDHGDAQDVEACCLSKSPDEAVDAYCRIDAAQDMCVTASDQLNALRQQLPVIPKLKEINSQLENLNKFIASSETQTSCAQTYAKGLIDAGDIELGSQDGIGWAVEAPHELDPDQGWPWFRNIKTGVPAFSLKGGAATGVACQGAGLGVLQGGTLQGGRALVTNDDAQGEAGLKGGHVDFREADCEADACAFELASLDLTVEPFELDGMRLTDISARLVAPAEGKITSEGVVRIPGSNVKLEVRGRVDGDEQTHQVRAQGDVLARHSADGGFTIESLQVVNWPITLDLTTAPVRAAPAG